MQNGQFLNLGGECVCCLLVTGLAQNWENILEMELLMNIVAWILFFGLDCYHFFGRIFIKLFFPLAKARMEMHLAGIGLNTKGQGPLGIIVYDEREFYTRIALGRVLGLFEAHQDKICAMNDVKAIAVSVMKTRRTKEFIHPFSTFMSYFNLQTRSRAWQVGVDHYDVGNDIYETMLDRNMQYTCGYWRNASNLDEAQLAKMELIAHKLKLSPGMSVLDIGCGFGTLAHHLAAHYGVSVVGCSISKEQTKYGAALCSGLPVEFRLCDYRDLDEKFDRVVSVGMFEHVGSSNYSEFFSVCSRCLKEDGILLLHCIGNNHDSVSGFDMWSHKYIFPNGYVPHYMDICRAVRGSWVIEDWQNFGHDYSKTLECWEARFEAGWEKLAPKYGDKFYRMWIIYLSAAQALFKTRSFQLWQIVLSKDGLEGGYESVRE